jgi:hypothetical protein
MTKRNRDLAKRTGTFTAGSDHATGLAAGDPLRAATPQFTGWTRRTWPAARCSGSRASGLQNA